MIRVGTSGYSYDDWHRWFYPQGLKPAERLSFYAERFSCVEVNSTYYRQPTLRLMSGLARKVPDSFRFAVKVYGGITHDWRHATEGDYRVFAAALAPLTESGLLGAVLAQFPQSFRPTKETVAHVKRLREAWPELPLVVEFRHRDWLDEHAFELLRQQRLGFCCVDEPPLEELLPPLALATAAIGYVRFHGRNAEQWHQHEHAWQRYDYLYRAEELALWVPRIKTVAAEADDTYVLFNNHYDAQAVLNAGELLAQLELVEREDDKGQTE